MKARHQSATSRRELRRMVRGRLGVGSDPAPEAVDTLIASRLMGELLQLATDGRYTLSLRERGAEELRVDYARAIREARG